MATQESTLSDLDLTPSNAPLERVNLVKLNGDATPRDMIVLAHYLSMQAAEIIENWPSERAMPLALFDGIERLESLLNHLEHSTRPQGSGIDL